MAAMVFIVGSPRSGTTLLGDILDLHPKIARWYEPYFVLDRYFRDAPNDCRTSLDATDEVRKYISEAFDYYVRRRRCHLVIDKSPRNSLKIPFLRRIFPEAQFIHIIRDGRDTTLSIHKEWQKRKAVLSKKGGYSLEGINTIKRFMDRQPLFVHKVNALVFETGGLTSLLRGVRPLHRLRWENRIGWGPRINNWQSLIDKVSSIEFSALQWVRCVETVIEKREIIDRSQYLEIRYEDFLDQPKEVLEKIFDFLEVSFPRDFMSRLPVIKRHNHGKWKDALSREEKARIGPIINDMQVKLGYANSDAWYKKNP